MMALQETPKDIKGLDEMKFGARIKVVGVGGSGSNAVDHMINSGLGGVDFICINCDTQDLHRDKAEKKIHIGKNLTRGLGMAQPCFYEQGCAVINEELIPIMQAERKLPSKAKIPILNAHSFRPKKNWHIKLLQSLEEDLMYLQREYKVIKKDKKLL